MDLINFTLDDIQKRGTNAKFGIEKRNESFQKLDDFFKKYDSIMNETEQKEVERDVNEILKKLNIKSHFMSKTTDLSVESNNPLMEMSPNPLSATLEVSNNSSPEPSLDNEKNPEIINEKITAISSLSVELEKLKKFPDMEGQPVAPRVENKQREEIQNVEVSPVLKNESTLLDEITEMMNNSNIADFSKNKMEQPRFNQFESFLEKITATNTESKPISAENWANILLSENSRTEEVVQETEEMAKARDMLQQIIEAIKEPEAKKTMDDFLEKINGQFPNDNSLQEDDNSYQKEIKREFDALVSFYNEKIINKKEERVDFSSAFLKKLNLLKDETIEEIQGKKKDFVTEKKTLEGKTNGFFSVANLQELHRKVSETIYTLKEDTQPKSGTIDLIRPISTQPAVNGDASSLPFEVDMSMMATKIVEGDKSIASEDNVVPPSVQRNGVSLAESLQNNGEKRAEMSMEQLKKEVTKQLVEPNKWIGDKNRLWIQLNPREMGTVDVLFIKTQQQVEIFVEYEKKATRGELEDILREIKSNLKEKDIDVQVNLKEKESEKNDEKERKEERKKENDDNARKVIKNQEIHKFNELVHEMLGGN